MDQKDFMEAKHDEEQKAKLQEIFDLLMVAGYFRVRLKGLSAFDKVVGGIVWCLEMAAIDIDVNFLFRENLNIKEKIEITEKIIQVLVSIKCAYALEPHQIQGLDTVNILPVVQWLVKKAMETRDILNEHLKAVAVYQYQKNLRKNAIEAKNNIQFLNKPFLPHRKFKRRQDCQPLTGPKQVLCTLMEYNHLSTRLLESDESLSDRVEAMDFPEKSVYKKTESKALAHCVTSLIHQQTPVISKAIEDYIRKQAEQKEERDEVKALENQKKTMLQAVDEKIAHRENQLMVLEQLKLKMEELRTSHKQLEGRKSQIEHLETAENKQIIEQLNELVVRNEELNQQRKEFKNQCKVLLQDMQTRNNQLRLECAKEQPEKEELLNQQLDGARQQLSSTLKILGEKNVTLSKLRRQLDAVPGSSELNQYHRRFTELCTQVNDKQTELNSYYLLHNSLEDSKVYLNKELSLLTSIHETFSQSIQNSSNKIEFIEQMEKILGAVRQNKVKVDAQMESLLTKQDHLQRSLLEYTTEEQHYRTVLKLLSQESHTYKKLITQLNAISAT